MIRIPISAIVATFVALFTMIFPSASMRAEVRLPSIISDHMMLQRDQPARIWGWADSGEEVSVSFRRHRASTTTGANGRWEVSLPPLHAGGPDELAVQGKNAITVADVLVGEVWVGSGQSNMVFSVGRSNNADKEIASANFPKIRLFKVTLAVADEPRDDVAGRWQICSPETIADFSGVGYFFARELHQDFGVPFGVIQSAWGGTPAESWTTSESLNLDPALKVFGQEWKQALAEYPAAKREFDREMAKWESAAAKAKKGAKETPPRPREPRGPGHQHTPAGLYNAMIAPLTPYAIRGVIWYQGENNASRGQGFVYRQLFKTMILDWRREWAQGDLPFLFVQLANYAQVPETAEWPELREAQTMALELKNTGMAVTIDIGESDDIHPTNKQDVGHRLALAARHAAYGQEIVYSGPQFRQTTVEAGRLRLWFDQVGSGLVAKGGTLMGFEVAGADGKYVVANAVIDGETVLVSAPSVKSPARARYGWANDPKVNFFNRRGLPAIPFRTEAWWGE